MLPEQSQDALRESLFVHGSVAKAALSLSGCMDDLEDLDDFLLKPAFDDDSLHSVLDRLKRNLNADKVKLRVDEDDILNDALAYYKSQNFDPKNPVRILFNGQPAADTGGVTRQFFTQLLQSISEECFHGSSTKTPVYKADMVASDVMKLIGNMIVHSVLQGGPAFPVFSESVYTYLVTGDVNTAMTKLSVDDCTERIKHFIRQVCNS